MTAVSAAELKDIISMLSNGIPTPSVVGSEARGVGAYQQWCLLLLAVEAVTGAAAEDNQCRAKHQFAQSRIVTDATQLPAHNRKNRFCSSDWAACSSP
jgi:hypothetical protein